LELEITEGWGKKDLFNLLRLANFELFYVDLSLFEIYTKSLKLILQHTVSLDVTTIQGGFNSIIYTDKLQRINWWEHSHEPEIILKLKNLHNDSIDCMLFYISVILCDCLATFDSTLIKELKNSEFVSNWIEEINPNFMIWMNDLQLEKKRFLDLS
jgi:hypothetical protein